MDFEALADKLSLTGNADGLEALRRRVGAMLRDGQLIQNRRRGLVPVDTEALIAGRISAHPDGFGFVITDDGDKDVYLNGKQMRQVLHGDRVVVSITGTDQRGRREGRIVDVVERANKSLVGRLSIDRGTVVVLPDNKRIHQDLLIAHGELAGAVDGDMVVAEIIEQPSRRHQPVGRVTEVLGQHLRPGMEIDVALHSYGNPVEWPDEVVDQAASFSPTVDASAAAGRRDVRELSLITIDGVDARDFDDAVWCESLESGWRLIVAIADVAHYVSPDSPLDKEAIERGTSVYFPGRVVPMLPEVLSNGLCSLNPDVDRLCMMCELTLDEKAGVRKTRFYNGIMRSHARLTYDQVSEMLTDPQSPLRDKHQALTPMIEELHRLYKALAKKRKKRGAIEFDSNETHIIFDENKKIREIIPIQRNDAHKLIEECMILANIEAASFLEERQIPALYRVHSGPKADRLEDLRAFLALRNLSLGGGESPTALDYAMLAEQIVDLPDRSVIQTVMLRSMQQAVYQPKNEGHFGLALDHYAHFTSPIRRYPDLLVHRAIKHALTRARSSDYQYSLEAMQALGESCSLTERRAEEASREVVSWLKCEYMQEHVGSEFPGVISAVTSFGLFVELTGIHVEGLVHITNLSRDYYRFDQAAQALIGERTGRKYHLGDTIVVRVAAVNLEERKIDFNEVEQAGSTGTSYSGKSRKRVQPAAQPDLTPEAIAAKSGGQSLEAQRSAEQRRQDKKRRKQKRRDNKRAAARAARQAAAGDNAAVTQTDDTVSAVDHSSVVKQEVVASATPIAGKKPVSAKKSSPQAIPAESESEKTASPDVRAVESTGKGNATGKKTQKRSSRKKVTGKAVGVTEASGKVVAEKVVGKASAASKSIAKKPAATTAAGKKSALSKSTDGVAVARKSTARKAANKKVDSGKSVASKKVAKKSVGKTPAAEKAVVGKAVARKAIAKKAAVGKVAVKKTAVRKASAKKVAARKAVPEKLSAEKGVARKAASGTATATKITSKKAVASKTVAKKSSAKKAATKKTAAKKTSASKAKTRKKAGSKAAARKVATSKTAGKKRAGRKSGSSS